MGLYERLLQEVTQEAEENPERDEQRRRGAAKRQRMQTYVNRRRRRATSGGYVTSQEMEEEQDRHLADLQALYGLVSGGVSSFGAGYRLAYLRNKYPVEYARLRDIEISSK
jgi:hypothetical protein